MSSLTIDYKVFKYNEGDFHTKYNYLFNCNCSNDVARFIINSSDQIIIHHRKTLDGFGYLSGKTATIVSYMYKSSHVAQIRLEEGEQSAKMLSLHKVEVDPTDKALIEDYINSVSDINTEEKLNNDKIDFWISHLNELKILNYKQSIFVKNCTSCIKEKYYEDEDELVIEFCSSGGGLLYAYTETPDEIWSKTNFDHSFKVYKSEAIDDSKYYKFEVNKYHWFDIELYS